MSVVSCQECHQNYHHSMLCQPYCSSRALTFSCRSSYVSQICRSQKVFFSARYKKAQVMPLLKKSGLDSSLPSNFRPISNLNTISKILERLVLIQLRPHLLNSSNFSEYQSGYRTGHSTETALLEVLDGIHSDRRQAAQCHHRTYIWHLTLFSMIHCLIDFAMSSASRQLRCPGVSFIDLITS